MSVSLAVHVYSYWAALVVLCAGAISPWIPALRSHRRRLLQLGAVLLSLSIGVRWVIATHPPIFGGFENTLAASWFLVVALLLVDGPLRSAVPEGLGEVAGLWLLPILVAGIFFTQTPYPLTISERSLVVDLHAACAWIAHTVLLFTASAALRMLVSREAADDDAWDAVLFRGSGIGFAVFTVMIGAGMVYSYMLFADWFQWEIVEALAAATWLTYASVLHARMLFNWKGRRLAWLVVAATVLMLGTLWVWSVYAGTYHYFDIVEIRAL